MVNQVPYVQPNDNVGAQNMMVKQSLIGDGVAAVFTSGNPNGTLPGSLAQMAMDVATGTLYVNTDGATSWIVFGAGSSIPFPYVDLSRAPYNVVPDDPAAGVANAVAINQAITDWSGTGASLLLPSGETYVDQPSPGVNYSVRFINGTTDVFLAGWGARASTLVQNGAGHGGEWNCVVVDGALNVGMANMGLMQGTIGNPDPVQQNHLLALYNALGPVTNGFDGVNLYFGKALGDAIRGLGDTAVVESVRFTNVVMRLAGIVNIPSGRIGARSGLSLQRNVVNWTVTNIDIEGAQNGLIDFEPTGVGGTVDNIRLFNVRADNTQGSLTGIPVAIGGSAVIACDNLIVDQMEVIGGAVSLRDTNNAKLSNITIRSEAPFPADPTNSSLIVRATNNGLQVAGLDVRRIGTSGIGPCVDVENLGTSASFSDVYIEQATAAVPFHSDGTANLTVDVIEIVYTGAAPSARDAIEVQAITANSDNPTVTNVRLASSTGRMQAAVSFIARAPRTMQSIAAVLVQSRGSAFHSVLFDVGAGSTFDANPIVQACQNGTDDTWRAQDAAGVVINTIYPVTAGNRGDNGGGAGQACLHMEGLGAPAMAAPNASTYQRLDGGALTTYYVRVAGAWVPIA